MKTGNVGFFKIWASGVKESVFGLQFNGIFFHLIVLSYKAHSISLSSCILIYIHFISNSPLLLSKRSTYHLWNILVWASRIVFSFCYVKLRFRNKRRISKFHFSNLAEQVKSNCWMGHLLYIAWVDLTEQTYFPTLCWCSLLNL